MFAYGRPLRKHAFQNCPSPKTGLRGEDSAARRFPRRGNRLPRRLALPGCAGNPCPLGSLCPPNPPPLRPAISDAFAPWPCQADRESCRGQTCPIRCISPPTQGPPSSSSAKSPAGQGHATDAHREFFCGPGNQLRRFPPKRVPLHSARFSVGVFPQKEHCYSAAGPAAPSACPLGARDRRRRGEGGSSDMGKSQLCVPSSEGSRLAAG
jgi:hypothetical protein